MSCTISVKVNINTPYTQYTDGSKFVRKGVIGGMLVIDITLTELGFSGIEDTDWERIKIVG